MLGFAHPDQLLSQLSSSQFGEWMAYATVEPFGEFRSELRHGQQMALHANINRDSKAKPEPYTPIDFMNFVEKPEKTVIDLGPKENARLIKAQINSCMAGKK